MVGVRVAPKAIRVRRETAAPAAHGDVPVGPSLAA